MVMAYACGLQIEDVRHHPADTVRSLRRILSEGGRVTPDPKRPDFYEVASDSTVYYIHVSPVSGKILLLATWPNLEVLEQAHAAA
jgi:hypothetical protein